MAYAARKKETVTGDTPERRTKTAENEILRTPASARRWIIAARPSHEPRSAAHARSLAGPWCNSYGIMQKLPREGPKVRT
jgi:hypothetical protein